jgi:hypothetical protein
MAPGTSERPAVRRLIASDWVTAFEIQGAGVDDLYVLCEEGVGPVTVGDVVFEGRALLLRRRPELRAFAVDLVSVVVEGRSIHPD